MNDFLYEDTLDNCLSKIIDYRGKTPKKLGGDWSLKGYRAVSANNVKFDGLHNLEDVRCLSSEMYKKWMKEEVKCGDILLTSEAPAGQAMVWDSEEKIVLSQRLYGLRVNEKLDNWFLKYYIQSKTGQSEIVKNNSGSTVFGISAQTFRNIVVRHPDIKYQIQIGKVLSNLDKKIQLNNIINAKLELLAKTIYEYWFVQFDFPDSNGKPYKASGGKMVWNEKLKREIPFGWETGILSDIANIIMGQSPPGESYNETGNGIIFFQGCTDFSERFPKTRLYTSKPSRFAKSGDILLSVRAPVGTLNIADEDCCIGRGLAALNSKFDSITHLHEVMQGFEQIFSRRNVNGTTFGSITKNDLYTLPILKPEKLLLQKYHQLIYPTFEQQNILAKENRTLGELRDWLIPMLMNGQVKVVDS